VWERGGDCLLVGVVYTYYIFGVYLKSQVFPIHIFLFSLVFILMDTLDVGMLKKLMNVVVFPKNVVNNTY